MMMMHQRDFCDDFAISSLSLLSTLTIFIWVLSISVPNLPMILSYVSNSWSKFWPWYLMLETIPPSLSIASSWPRIIYRCCCKTSLLVFPLVSSYSPSSPLISFYLSKSSSSCWSDFYAPPNRASLDEAPSNVWRVTATVCSTRSLKSLIWSWRLFFSLLGMSAYLVVSWK